MEKLGQPLTSRGQKSSGLVDDILVGDTSNNALHGGIGNDLILGGAADDTLSGDRGKDVLLGGQNNDLLFGRAGSDFLLGEEGSDQLQGGKGKDILVGGVGNDGLLGGSKNDILSGGEGNDTLTGGGGADSFLFSGNVFSGGTPLPVETTGIEALNSPDVITDYEIGKDQFVFNARDLGIPSLTFQKGVASEIAANGNFIVQLNPSANAATAALAIADNPAITAEEGVFIYFNTTLGINRLVYSQDLANGGDISVLANLTNQAKATGLESLNNYTASDFSLI